MRGKEGYITGWSNVISRSFYFFFFVLFKLPTMSKNKGCRQEKKGKRYRGMKIEEEGGSVFPSI